MALSTRDLRKIIETIDVIYSLPDNRAMFRAVCEKLQRHIGYLQRGFHVYRSKDQRLPDQADAIVSQIANGALVLYARPLRTIRPFRDKWMALFGESPQHRCTKHRSRVEKQLADEVNSPMIFFSLMVSVFYRLAAALGFPGRHRRDPRLPPPRSPSATLHRPGQAGRQHGSPPYRQGRFTTGILMQSARTRRRTERGDRDRGGRQDVFRERCGEAIAQGSPGRVDPGSRNEPESGFFQEQVWNLPCPDNVVTSKRER